MQYDVVLELLCNYCKMQNSMALKSVLPDCKAVIIMFTSDLCVIVNL
jgi:hypothetical protein